MCNPKSKKGRGTSSPIKKPTCGKRGKKDYNDCLVGTDNCFGSGKSGHKVRDFPNLKGQVEGRGKTQDSSSNVDPPKKNHYYALSSRGKKESSPNVGTGMLQVFSIDVYALLNPSAMLYFINFFISIFPDIINEHFMVTTLVGESVVEKRVYRNFPIMFPNIVTHFELVELYMVNFDVILRMNWLHDCFDSIDCRTRIVKFNFSNEPVL